MDPIDAAPVAALREILRLPTVASADPETTDPAPFVELHSRLREHFPLTH